MGIFRRTLARSQCVHIVAGTIVLNFSSAGVVAGIRMASHSAVRSRELELVFAPIVATTEEYPPSTPPMRMVDEILEE